MANPTPEATHQAPNHSRIGTKNKPGIIKPGAGGTPKVKVTQLPPPGPAGPKPV